MKKMLKWPLIAGIALLLVAAMIVGIAAGGKKERYPKIADLLDAKDYEGAIMEIYNLYQQDQGPTETTKPEEKPTDEEREQLRNYCGIVQRLMSYAEEGGSISVYATDEQTGEEVYLYGSRALEYYYKQIQQMTAVDKWAGTKFTTSEYISSADEVNWNRQEILNGFYILSDKKLEENRSSVDNMGNVNDSDRTGVWYYNADGSLKRGYENINTDNRVYYYNNSYTCYYTYDEKGNLLQKQYGSDNNVEALITCTVDANGNVTVEHLKTNSVERDYTFTYGEDGKLSQISWQYNESTRYTIDYTYDDDGNLVKEEKTRFYYNSGYEKEFVDTKWIMTYTYTNGALTSGVFTVQEWTYTRKYTEDREYVFENYAYNQRENQHTYTCDQQGRVVKEVIAMGETVVLTGEDAGKVTDKPTIQTRTYETLYGDFYEYAPKK